MKLGIDFGTSTILVTRWDENENSNVEIVNGIGSYGANFVENVVYIKDADTILIGDSAKTYVNSPNAHQENYISGIKRHLLNPEWRCSIIADGTGETLTFTAPEVCTMVFRYISDTVKKNHPNDFKEDEPIHVVLSVPYDYKADTRNIISESAEKAGLLVESLIEEPIAASMSYGIFNDALENGKSQNIMIVDFGGGTLDTTAFSFTSEEGGRTKIETLATGGDSKLGGLDITRILKEHYTSKLSNKLDNKTEQQVFDRCNEYKEILSDYENDTDSIEIMIEGMNFEYVEEELTLGEYRQLLEENGIFDKMKKTFDDCVSRSGISKTEFDKVILVGGTCKISLIQKYIEEYFGKKPIISTAVDIFELVGLGAGLYCKSLTLKDNFNYYIVQKVIYSIGVFSSGINGGSHFNPFVKSNSKYDEYVDRRFGMKQQCGTAVLDIYQAPADDSPRETCKKIGYIDIECDRFPNKMLNLSLKIQNHDILYKLSNDYNEEVSKGSIFKV